MQARTASNVLGIDVSHHQGVIEWKKVAAAGVKFAFIKATEGGSIVDDKLAVYTPIAAGYGIKIGFYHYAHPELNAPETEAANFFRAVKQYKSDFPLVLDVEGAASKLGADKLTKWCLDFLNAVERLTGRPTMIYTGASFARSYLGAALAKWPLWVAHYGVDTPMSDNTWPVWSVFQYTSSGKIDGIVGNVDVNAMELTFYNRYAGSVPVPTKDDTIKVVVNDKLAAYGRLINGHVYLPLRQLGEALGHTVDWDAKSSTPFIDGKPLQKFELIDGKTYLAVREAAERLGAKVSWDGTTKKVYIYE